MQECVEAAVEVAATDTPSPLFASPPMTTDVPFSATPSLEDIAVMASSTSFPNEFDYDFSGITDAARLTVSMLPFTSVQGLDVPPTTSSADALNTEEAWNDSLFDDIIDDTAFAAGSIDDMAFGG